MEHQFPMMQGTLLRVMSVDSSPMRSVTVLYEGCQFRTDYESQQDASLLQANDELVVKKHDTPTAGVMVKRRVNRQTDDFWYMLHDFKHEQPCPLNMTSDTGSLFDRMYQHIIIILALNTNEQIRTWQYILVAYCQLEALALELLRLHQGKDEQTFWRNPPTWSLNHVANKLHKHNRVSEEIIQILSVI